MRKIVAIISLFISCYLNAQYSGMDSVQFANGFKGLALKPSDYDANPAKRYPLIVALGGNGEVGGQLAVLFNHGIPRRVRLGKEMYQVMTPGDTARFIYICPLPDVSTRGGQPNFMNAAIDYMVANYRVDTTKILVSGLSQGANDVLRYGLWTPTGDPNLGSFGGFDYRQQRVRFYVSSSPPLVGTPYSDYYSRFKTYGWGARFFHGANDGGLTPPSGSQVMNDSINANHPGSSQRFLLAGYGHDDNVWDSMYSTNGLDSNRNIYRWLVMSPPGNVIVQPPPNTAPLVNAGVNQMITLPASTVSLNGTGSGTNGATIVSYSWVKTSGPLAGLIASPGTGASLVTGLVQGTYVFTLTVTDNHGLSSSSSVTVTVNPVLAPPNQPPVSNAGSNQVITLPVSSVSLNGTGTGVNGATIVSYLWSQTSGPSTAVIASPGTGTSLVTGLVQGTYVFTLTVTDNHGLSNGSGVIITVNPRPNQPPVANAGADITITLPVNTATLDGSLSNDPDGTISGYSWNKLSGPGATTIVNSTTATASVIGLQAGQYVFELTVTDNSGATARDQVTVTVNAALLPGNQAPVADAGKDTTISLPSAVAVVTGVNSKDPDGSISTYSWKEISGPSSAVIADAGAVVTAVSGLAEGVYVFELTVTDNAGAGSSASVKVTVVNNFRYSELFKLYPNPVGGGILHLQYIDDKTGKINVAAYDVTGKQVLGEEMSKEQSLLTKDINVSVLKPGMYYLEIVQTDGKKLVRPFVKQ